MTWTFTDSATPSEKDRVRILVGDTDTTDQLISDESINLYLTGGSFDQGNVRMAAAKVAETIAAKFARRVASSMGGTSVQLQQQVEHYERLAKRLRAQAGIAVYAGGISRDDKDTYVDDDDNVVPAFTRRGDDPPNTAPLTREDLGH